MINFDNKTTISFKVAMVLLPLVSFLEKYVFKDWEFLLFLAVLILLDTFLGLYINFRGKTISSRGFSRFFEKVLIYICVLIMAHVLKNYSVSGETNAVFSWVDKLFYAAIVVRESISIIENIGLINSSLLPAWILKRLKLFDESGDPKVFVSYKADKE